MPGNSVPPGRSGSNEIPERRRRSPFPPAVHLTPAEEITATTAGEFAELLRLLQVRSGVTAGEIGRRSGIARSQVYALIQHDRRVLPTQLAQVRTFTQACGLAPAQVTQVEALWVGLREAADRPQPAPSRPQHPVSTAPDAPMNPMPAAPLQDAVTIQPAAQPSTYDRPTYDTHPKFVVELVEELKTLRRGRGVLEARLEDRIGYALRWAFEIPDGSPPRTTRRIVITRLTELANQLPHDLRKAVLAALALLPDAQQRFYQERVRWVAEQMDRDERTVHRRINEGLIRLAELAYADIRADADTVPLDQGPTWYTEKLRVAVVLDEPNPTAFEWRRIVSNRDGLDEIDLAFTLTAPPVPSVDPAAPALDIRMLYGGRLVTREKVATRRFAFSILLAKPLERNECCEYALKFQVPAGQVMQPHYVCLPRERCKLFDLRVRFDQNNMPTTVWQLAKTFQSDLDDPASHGTKVELDAAGELRLRFEDLAPGFAYGARWDPAPPRETAESGGFQSH